MGTGNISPAAMDYIQRQGIDPGEGIDGAASTTAPPELRRVFRICGISSLQKGETQQAQRSIHPPTENLLIGLTGNRVPIPIAFVLEGDPTGLRVHLGIWSSLEHEHATAEQLSIRQKQLKAILYGLYPGIELSNSDNVTRRWPLGGIGMGVPIHPKPDARDESNAIDRLARAMTGENWAAIVLAEPIKEDILLRLRHQLNKEMRSIEAVETASGASSPEIKSYGKLLQGVLAELTRGQSVGAWRTAVYLLGDENSYPILAGVWRTVFSGTQSLPEPVRVFDHQAAVELAEQWAMPDIFGPAGPSGYRHPYGCQTLLTSSQLCSFIQLPRLELPGFSVKATAMFDAMPPKLEDKKGLNLGRVMHQARPTSTEYLVSPEALTRHTFITGVTGAGKTTTIFHLLRKAAAFGIPFLVIEPAKTEYRALLEDPALKDNLQIFTLGNEKVTPLRLNPFEAVSGTPVSVHLDLLRSAFSASFGLWSVLPAVLEQCLHRVYEDRGWDTAANDNSRLDNDSDPTDAFPTLADLAAKADEVTRALAYGAESEGNIRATLLTRINSLRMGSKGRMLDVQRSFPMSLLMERHTVLELEDIGDDDDKAFLMGLLFIRLVEFRRAEACRKESERAKSGSTDGTKKALQHLLVIEEAHRLLSAVSAPTGEQEANPRGKAVESFSNLIAEIRAYGQGVIIADQVPANLAPSVMKNTNLKIAHRVLSSDDRASLAGAMNMTERQARALETLPTGHAAVFSDGDDAPVLVRVTEPPDKRDKETVFLPDDARVIEQMKNSLTLLKDQELFLPSAVSSAWKAAVQIVEDPQFQRTLAHMVLSTIENTDALDRLWPGLLSVVQAKRPPRKIDEQELLRCVVSCASQWFSHRRGAQGGWTYSKTEEFARRLREMLLTKLSNENPEPIRTEFRQYAYALHPRQYAPFPACEQVCRQQPPVCLYRRAVADLIAKGTQTADWSGADKANTVAQAGQRSTRWSACLRAGYYAIEFPKGEWPEAMQRAGADAARRVSLCFAQQMLASDATKLPSTVSQIMDQLLAEADAKPSSGAASDG